MDRRPERSELSHHDRRLVVNDPRRKKRTIAPSWWQRLRSHPLAKLGPGLVTGAADDDPSGIATYSQAGAQFGLNMLWTMPLTYPLMSAVQVMCARIGLVTGKGLAANIKANFPPWVITVVVALLLLANTLNIAADVVAMGEAAHLVTGLSNLQMTTLFVVVTLLLQIFVPYHNYVRYLKWLTLSLLAYGAVMFTIHVPWAEVVLRTLWPRLRLDSNAAAVVVAVFGTTISPYLFFWQASQEVEDQHRQQDAPLVSRKPSLGKREFRRVSWDSWTGMLFSNLTAYFIILSTALTLHAAGVRNIKTAAEAAEALRPLAGDFAFLLFALGILGTGLIGVPVLAGSGAYALSEAMGWRWGLERKATDAVGFYGVITVSLLAALVLQFSPINPIKALFWSSVINGIVAVPLMVVIILLSSKRSVMGSYVERGWIRVLAWIATAVMGMAVIWMFLPHSGPSS